MGDLTVLDGRRYGPATLVPTSATTARWVAVTGDDDRRWLDAAPPAWAGAILFAIAPEFLADPDVAAHGGGVVHADQSFAWHAPFHHDVPLVVTGEVTRVRARGDNAWVSFSLTADGPGGRVLDAASTFIVTGTTPDEADERPEPPVDARGPHDPTGPERSASRADLVGYAAASGDLNPIHWDHDSAVAAGLPGIVCHGLLLSAWCTTAAIGDRSGLAPLASAKARFRAPVPAAAPCRLTVTVDDDRRTVTLATDDGPAMTLDAVVTP
ncbi:MAG: MaoC family dehydratase [Acidimicrobiia bacterium]